MCTDAKLDVSKWPWVYNAKRIYPGVDDADGYEVAEVHGNAPCDGKLIASAPELYDCLVDAIGCLERCSDAKIYEGRVARYRNVIENISLS